MKYYIGYMARAQSGFTLVEILVAMAVLGTLLAAALPNMTGYMSRARNGAWEADQRAIQAAMDAYFSDVRTGTGTGTTGAYPTLDGTIATTTTVTVSTSCILGTETTTASGPCIDFAKLLGSPQIGRVYLRQTPASAGAFNNTVGSATEMVAGTGSYTWYIGADGLVRSDPPVPEGNYP